jgi:hypothetical protein
MSHDLNMHVTTCPFCGVDTDVPHNTQEGCIEALHGEIGRMRRLLDQVKPHGEGSILGGDAPDSTDEEPRKDPKPDRA